MTVELGEGTRLGRYRLLRLLARGGMGAVWEAFDETLQRQVALKVLPESLLTDEPARRRFEREARALARLLHPNVVTVFDLGADDPHTGEEVPFLVMELVPGHSLQEVLRHGRMAVDAAVAVAVQVARALGAAHSAGIVHRDLKPSNVMVGPDGHVTVLDFGLARLFAREGDRPEDTLTSPGMVLGSCSYMAPEQALGRGVVPASDVFACGAVLYEMLTGRRAFDGPTPLAALQAVVSASYAPLAEAAPEVPERLAELVARCLERDVEARPPDGSALAVALAAVEVERAPTTQMPFTPSPRSAPSVRSRRRWRPRRAAAAAGAVLVGAGLLAAGAALGRRGTEPVRPDPGRWSTRVLLRESVDLRHPSWAPDGQRLLVERLSDVSGEVLVVPLAGGEPVVLARAEPGEILAWPRFSPDARAVVVTAVGGREETVQVLPAVGGPPVLEVPGSRGTWLADGRVAFSRASDGVTSLWTVDPADGSERLLEQGSEERPWWWVEEGPRGMQALGGGGPDDVRAGIFVRPRPGAEPETWLEPGRRGSSFSWAPSGRSLVVVSESRLARVDRGGLATVLPLRDELKDPAFAPDGTQMAAVSGSRSVEVLAVDPDGGPPSCLVCGLDALGWGSAAPGGAVVFRRQEGDERALYLRTASGEERRVSAAGEDASCPAVSPDGARLAYLARGGAGTVALRVVPLAGGEPVTVAEDVAGSEFPSWSADGRLLTYAAGSPLQAWVVSAAGGPPRQVSRGGGDYPRFSADGAWIAWVVWTDASDPLQGVWVAPAAGGEPARIGSLPTQLGWDPASGALLQLRRGEGALELWQAEPGAWSWRRRAVLDLGRTPPPYAEHRPFTVDPAGRLVVNRPTTRSELLVMEGIDPRRW